MARTTRTGTTRTGTTRTARADRTARAGREQPPPTVAEIAALTGRLRHLRRRDATDAERAAFRADADALLSRIPDDLCPPPGRKDS